MRVSFKRAVCPLCMVGLLSAGLAARAQQSAAPARLAPPARAAAAVGFRISGKVVDAHSGAALGRCSVEIADVKDRARQQTVTTGDDGNFQFAGLPLGKYSLTAERRGYLAQSYEEHEQFSTAIAVGPGLESENLIFKLTAEAVIAGTVTDEAGEPVRGAQVRLFEDQDSRGIRTTQQRHTAMTDDRGVYELAGLRPGAYFLVVTAHPWYAQRLHPMRTGADGSQQAEEPNAQAQALDVAYPTTFYPGVTDQDAATPIPVKGGDRLEANITLAAQAAVRVRVQMPTTGGAGEPGRGFSVVLSQSIFGQAEQMPMQMMNDGNSLEVEGILPGHYDVTVNRFTAGQGRQEQGRQEAKHFEADVSGGGGEITEESAVGEITVAGKVVSAAGKATGGISLRIPNARQQPYGYGQLNDAGEFSMTVPAGTYEVVGNMNGLYIASMKAAGAVAAGRMLTIKAGDTPKLEIVAGTGHGEVEGVVRRDGKPASAVMVLLAPEDAKNNEILFRRDQSDSDGTFDLANIIPGRYRLLAIDDGWDLEWANPAVLQVFLAKSVAVEVRSGDHLQELVEAQMR